MIHLLTETLVTKLSWASPRDGGWFDMSGRWTNRLWMGKKPFSVRASNRFPFMFSNFPLSLLNSIMWTSHSELLCQYGGAFFWRCGVIGRSASRIHANELEILGQNDAEKFLGCSSLYFFTVKKKLQVRKDSKSNSRTTDSKCVEIF